MTRLPAVQAVIIINASLFFNVTNGTPWALRIRPRRVMLALYLREIHSVGVLRYYRRRSLILGTGDGVVAVSVLLLVLVYR